MGVVKPYKDGSLTIYLFAIEKCFGLSEQFIQLPPGEEGRLTGSLGFIGIVKKRGDPKRNFINPTVIQEHSI